MQPWRAQLSVFAREMAVALLPWLERLDLALGPLSGDDPQGDGDPDGFDGLLRRGPYERLLGSEWLLADEVPDEFLRRAAAGEHGFLALARKTPAASRVSAALFDVGPSQIGDPRVAHLAVLVALARRAQAAGARFSWGTLQGLDAPSDALDIEPLRRLIDARSRSEVSGEQVRAALDRPALRGALRETWFVGGPTLWALAGPLGAPGVEIVEPLELPAARLRVRVRRHGRSPVEIDLPLLPEAHRVRLLRDPFEHPRPAVREATPGKGAIFFSPNGRKLFLERAGGMAVYPVPNSPYASPRGDPTLILPAPAESFVAAGVHHNRIVALSLAAGGVVFSSFGKRGGLSSSPRFIAPPAGLSFTAPPHLTQLWLLPRPQKDPLFAFLDGAQRLFLVSPEGSSRLVLERVVALSIHNFILVAAHLLDDHLVFSTLGGDGEPERTTLSVRAAPQPRVFFGHCRGYSASNRVGLCAVELPSGRWAIFHQGSDNPYPVADPPADMRVVGVLSQPDGAAALLLLDGPGQTLRRWRVPPDTSTPRTEASLDAPLASLAACLSSAALATLTERGQLTVHTPDYIQPLLQTSSGLPGVSSWAAAPRPRAACSRRSSWWCRCCRRPSRSSASPGR